MTSEHPAIQGGTPAVAFQDPSIGLFTRNVIRLVKFYEGLGFRETYRNPTTGPPEHVELKLAGLTIAVSSVDAAIASHGLNPDLGGRPVYILLWTRDTDAAYTRLTAEGASSLRPPHDFLPNLRTAWVADPDGNPISLAQRRD
ncbi:MAG: VOC family protein [Thermoplasmata archaeon]